MLVPIRKPTIPDICRLLFVGAVWGASFVFINIALTDFGPVSIAAWRVLLAGVALLGVCLAVRSRFGFDARSWRLVVVIGCLNSAVPFFLISWGQQFISSAESAILMATGTFCSLIVSHFTSSDERINTARFAGVLTGFLGVAVLVVSDLLAVGFGAFKGQVAVMLAGCSYAISSVIARRVTHLPALSVSAAAMLSSAFYMVPLALLLENPLPTNPGLGPLVSIAFLGLVATALAFVVRFWIIRANGAVFMSQVGYLVPLFGVLWSWLAFAGTLGTTTIIALLLILLGIAITRKA